LRIFICVYLAKSETRRTLERVKRGGRILLSEIKIYNEAAKWIELAKVRQRGMLMILQQ
jgi:hypothetical protein